MTDQQIITAINACSYDDSGHKHYIECPKEHLEAMLTFIDSVCNGWYDCGRMDDEGTLYFIQNDVTNKVWRKEVERIRNR